MSGEVEYGICDECGEEGPVSRKYYRYNILCECHSPQHFDMVRHCNGCIPTEPIVTTVSIKTETLKSI